MYVFYIRSYSAAVRLLTTDGFDYDTMSYDASNLDLSASLSTDALGADKRCNNQVIKMTDDTADCNSVCPGGGYEKRVTAGRGRVPGDAYCVPVVLNSCHPNAGVVVKDTAGWSCVSLYPAVFGGRDADEIVACDGTLIDTESRKTYTGRIPRDMIISTNPERATKSDGSFRFVCPVKRDHMNNAYVATDVSRLRTTPNSCARTMYNDAGRSLPDFENGKCTCADSYVSVGGRKPYCAPPVKSTDTVQQFYEPCMNLSAPFDVKIKPCGATTVSGKNMSAMYKFDLLISNVGVSDYVMNDLSRPL